jgi:hypothetical protein
MEIIVSKLNLHHEGLMLALNTSEHVQPLAIINGNKPDFCGPVILLNLDQHIVYGLSHPEVVSRIFTKGPQQLISTREMSHNLFEHGMKVSLNRVKVKVNWFLTSLETFYTQTLQTPVLQIIYGRESNRAGCLVTPSANHNSLLLCNQGFEPREPLSRKYEKLEIDNIRTYASVSLKL